MACRPALRDAAPRQLALLALNVVMACAGILLIGWLIAANLIGNTPDTRLYVLAALGLAVIAGQRVPRGQLATAAALVLGVASLPYASAPVYTTRSFFGTHRVVDTAGGAFRLLLHGTTLHGIQHNGEAGERPTPIGYYYAGSPMARSVELARAAAGGKHPLQVGIVGLGTGALACYAQEGERWQFFEIDAAVARIATNPAYFRSLSACTPNAEIVLGDARLTLARQPAGSFDLLLLDAFSSDAIPVHLLTVEALALYRRLLAPHGILALHISNQNLDLPAVVEANLARLPDLTAVYAEGERGQRQLASQVILVSRQEDVLTPALQLPHARRLGAGTVRPWTDDYCDILSAMVRRLASKLAAVRG
jgi:predicted O-methyltransferase YrrM